MTEKRSSDDFWPIAITLLFAVIDIYLLGDD